MAMTFVQAVNGVLRRLRERAVTNTTDTDYATFVGDMVNDVIDELQSRYKWNSLREEVTITTSAGTDIYNITGSNQESFIMGDRVYDGTHNYDITRYPYNQIKRLQLYTTESNTTTRWFREVGFDTSNDELQVEFYPEVTGTWEITCPCYIPMDEITSDATIIKLPRLPIIYGTWARCISERGEDGGQLFNEIDRKYNNYIQDAVVRDSLRYTWFENDWQVN